MNHRLKRTLSGIFFMLTGTGGVLVLLGWMNQPPSAPKSEPTTSSVEFAVQKQAKPPAQKPAPKKKKTRTQKSNRKSALKPRIGNAIGSVSLAGFGMLDGMDDAVDTNLLGDTENVAMTEDTVDSPPMPMERKSPQIPYQLRKQGLSGRVLLQLLIDESGRVAETRILESEPQGVFDPYALEAARSWRFRPGMHNGKATAVWMKAPIQFQYGAD